MFPSFKLRSTVGRTYNVDLDDIDRTKKALRSLGFYSTPGYGMTPYPDEDTFKGIESFQRTHGLRVDGIMKPGGETERALAQRLPRQNPSCRSGNIRKAAFPWGDLLDGVFGRQQSGCPSGKGDNNQRKCVDRYQAEYVRCNRWERKWHKGCQDRAGARNRLCQRYGYPQPDDPAEWGPPDMEVSPPRR